MQLKPGKLYELIAPLRPWPGKTFHNGTVLMFLSERKIPVEHGELYSITVLIGKTIMSMNFTPTNIDFWFKEFNDETC